MMMSTKQPNYALAFVRIPMDCLDERYRSFYPNGTYLWVENAPPHITPKMRWTATTYKSNQEVYRVVCIDFWGDISVHRDWTELLNIFADEVNRIPTIDWMNKAFSKEEILALKVS